MDAIGAVFADNELLRADGTAHILLGSLVQSVDVLMVAVGKVMMPSLTWAFTMLVRPIKVATKTFFGRW